MMLRNGKMEGEGSTNPTIKHKQLKIGGVVKPSLSKRKRSTFNKNSGEREKINSDGDGCQQIIERHCVVCQKTISSETGRTPTRRFVTHYLRKVPKVVVRPNFLVSLNLVWPYVEYFRRKKNCDRLEVNEDENDLGLLVFEINKNRPIIFSKIPSICQFCADNVQTMSDLVSELKSQLKKLGEIIVESKSKKHDDSCLGRKKIGISNNADATCHPPTFFQRERVPLPVGNVDTTFKPSSSSSDGTGSRKERKASFEQPTQMRDSEETQKSGINCKLNDEELDIKVENMETECQSRDNFTDDVDYLSLNLNSNEGLEEGANIFDDDRSWDSKDNDGAVSDISDIFSADDYSSEASEVEKGTIRKYKRTLNLKKCNSKGAIEEKPSKKLECDVNGCEKSFSTSRGLTYHQSRYHPEEYPTDADRTYPCTCGKIFHSRKGRLSHLRTSAKHKGEELFVGKKRTVCDMCGVTETFEKLEAHVRGHVGDYAVKCPNALNCRYFFTNFLAISKHLERVKSCRKVIIGNGKGQTYFCETCDFKTDKVLMLRTHLKLNHERIPENRTLECPISGCAEMFSVRQSVHFHLKNNHNLKEIATQKCIDCLQEIKIKEMEQHLKSSHDAIEIIKCQQCPFIFASRQHLVDHLFVHRFDVDALICDVCNDGVKFSRHAGLRAHYYSAHQIGTKQYVCDECGKEFWNNNALSSHTKFHHTGEYKYKRKSFPCDLCYEPTEFASEDGLICHKINLHGADPFRCQICGTTFTAKVAFQRHERDHAGVRRKEYKCEVKGCEKIFSCRKSLNQHNDVIHEGNKYDCELCGKTYQSFANLKNHHKRSHLKIRPFVCDACGDSFVSKSVMQRHKLIHTGERPFVCTICGQRFRQAEVLKRHVNAHEKKGDCFKPNGPMKQIRKRVGE